MLGELFDSSDEENDEGIERRPRIYRRRIQYLNATDFRERFRVMPWQAELLLNSIGSIFEIHSRTLTAMSARDKLLCALRFYASDGFYYFDGDAQGIFKIGDANN